MKTTFMGGALSFKGDKKKKKKKAKKKSTTSKHKRQDDTAVPADNDNTIDDDDLTDAERKALKRKRERERKELEKVAKKSHRERVEEFNEKLGSLTEHNDIPRVRMCSNERFRSCVLLLALISHRTFSLFCRSVRLETDKHSTQRWCHRTVDCTVHGQSIGTALFKRLVVYGHGL